MDRKNWSKTCPSQALKQKHGFSGEARRGVVCKSEVVPGAVAKLVLDGAFVDEVRDAGSMLRGGLMSTKNEVVSAAGAEAGIADASSAEAKNSWSIMLVLVIPSASPRSMSGIHMRAQQILRQEQHLVSACACCVALVLACLVLRGIACDKAN